MAHTSRASTSSPGGLDGAKNGRRARSGILLLAPLLVSAVFAWLALLLFAPAVARGAPAVLHHDLAVSLHPESRTLTGTDTLTIRPDGASRLSLSLSRGALVSRLSVDGKAWPFIPFVFEDGMLGFPVPDEARGKTIEVTVAYEASFDDPVPENPVNTEDPAYGVKGSVSPRGTFLSESAGWYPDIPGGASTFRIRVDAPEGIAAVTAGTLVKRETTGGRTVSEWAVERPVPGLSLSAGRYVIRESAAGKTGTATYFFPGNDNLSETYLKAVAGYLDLYGKLFGPYPFEKFAVVENFFPTGYGFPSYTLLGSSVVRLPFIVETSLGHEIAHSWWGNGVYADPARGNWTEGLTTYVADHLYKERASSEEGREYRLRTLREYASLVPPEKDFPLKSFASRSDPVSRSVGYGKGAMVFHMARRLAGDDIFWRGLRHVARDRLGKAASWSDFDLAFSRLGGPDLGPFFRQWVERPGAPVLALTEVEARRGGNGWKVTGRLVQEKPYYELQVPLRLVTEGKTIDAVVPLSGEDVRFTLWADAAPRRLLADPDADLFRRLSPSEIPPTVNAIRGSASLTAVAARGLPPETLASAKTVLAALGREDVPVLAESEAPPSLLEGRDVLYLGLPEGPGRLPPLPKGLSVAPGAFTVEGTSHEAAGSALFAALPHPSGGGRVVALFLPLSPEAAARAARKIPHYGKYGYLAFTDGTNRAKGMWEPAASPLVHEFAAAPPAGRAP